MISEKKNHMKKLARAVSITKPQLQIRYIQNGRAKPSILQEKLILPICGSSVWRRKAHQRGTLALAEFQSAGRGRLGRSWEVPEGTSVMMSILLRPKFEPQYAPTPYPCNGMAVAKAVKSLGFDVSIKWPNDVVVSHKKICGILTEMGVRDGKIDYAVIGVGINVNIKEFPEEMVDKATSLYLESGRNLTEARFPGL